MITPSNTIAAFPGSNALVITDYADNLRRIEKVIASLDQPPGGERGDEGEDREQAAERADRRCHRAFRAPFRTGRRAGR